MNEQEIENDTSPAETSALSAEFMREVILAIEDEDTEVVQSLAATLDTQDLAELLNQLSTNQRHEVITALGDAFDENVLPYLESDSRDDVVETLGVEKTAEAIQELDSDDALYVIEELPQEQQQEILNTIDQESREELKEALSYPESSAGRLMRRQFVVAPEFWTVGDAIDHLRSDAELPEDFYVLFITDPKFHLAGEVKLSVLMRTQRDVYLRDIMTHDLHPISTTDDQEEVAYIFRKYALVEAPVVNVVGRLMGTITVDDVVDVISEEEEEDVMRSVGLSGQDLFAGLMETVGRRFPWLFVNLLTAVAASIVIGFYDHTIEKLVILAVLMPIIASMGGNAGIQAATVAVRAIAMRRISPGRALLMVRKELLIGLLNGIGIAAVTAAGIYALYQDWLIAAIFAAATIITMTVAGFSGAALPLILKKMGFDPAVSAGVFLTMLTDLVGFFTFLGLAAWIMQV